MPAFLSHSISREFVSRKSITLQAPVHGGADRPPSFQADPRSASHFAVISICDMSLCASSAHSFSLPDRSAKGIDALSHTWDFPGMLRAAFSGTREDSSVFAPVSSASPCLAQAAVKLLPRGVVSSTHSPSLPRCVSPCTGEFHTPVLHNVQSSPLDIIRDGYRGQGSLDRVAGFLAHSVWLSTFLVYDISRLFSVLGGLRDRSFLSLFL